MTGSGEPTDGMRLGVEQVAALAEAAAAVPPLFALLESDLRKVTETTEHTATRLLDDLRTVFDASDRAREAAEEDGAPRAVLDGMQVVGDVTEQLIAELMFQDITRQVVEKVVAVLNDLGAEFHAVSQALAGDATADTLADLTTTFGQIRLSYLTQLQRVLPEPVGEDVELF